MQGNITVYVATYVHTHLKRKVFIIMHGSTRKRTITTKQKYILNSCVVI